MPRPKKGFKYTLYCDSKAALSRVTNSYFDEFGTIWRCRANYDLEVAIRQCLQQCSTSVDWQWIRGHASKRKRRHQFTRAEELNEIADDLATAARQFVEAVDDDHWPEQEVSVIGMRGRMCGRLLHELRYCCTMPDLLSYWKTRYQWTQRQVELLDFLGTKAASSKLRGAKSKLIQKLRCGWLPVNDRQSRSNVDQDAGCSECSSSNLVVETIDHLFQCEGAARRRAVLDKLTMLRSQLSDWDTAPQLINTILAGATAWIQGQPVPDPESLSLSDDAVGQSICRAYSEQTGLGWNVFFRGFWTISWREAQDAYWTSTGRSDVFSTGESWSGKVQGWLFEFASFVWDLRNATEHGEDIHAQRQIRLANCERTIRRLYSRSTELPDGETHPFREPMQSLLDRPVSAQELWIQKTVPFLRAAFRRATKRTKIKQRAITEFFNSVRGSLPGPDLIDV